MTVRSSSSSSSPADGGAALETIAVQALDYWDKATGALVPPIQPGTTFRRDADGGTARFGRVYARDENPGYAPAEAVLAELEGGAAAMLFASGMAAAVTPFLTLRPGDHVVAQTVMYWSLRKWLLSFGAQWGISVDFAETGDMEALRAVVRPGHTRLVWVETPANPLWTIVDIAAAAAIAHEAGARLVVDSTVATPVLTRPLMLGADLVMHSATKYLNGHGDVVAGVLVTAEADAFWQELRRLRVEHGGILGSFEAWLLLRGLRTLFLRVRQSCASAMVVAKHLASHAQVATVLYPGLTDHVGHAVAARQMRDGFGGMLSVRMRGGSAHAAATAARTRVFKCATSLGGIESLIEHRARIEGPNTPVPDDLLRLSVGLEATPDLLADLDQAMAPAASLS